MSETRSWFLYIVECSDGSFYTGITTDVARRINQHNKGRGARYTSTRRPVKILGVWQFPDRRSAMQAEIALKTKPRSDKIGLLDSAGEYRNGIWVSPRQDE